MQFNLWHYEIDTLPHFEQSEKVEGLFNLSIPLGIYPYTNERMNVIIEFKVNDSDIERIGFNRNNPLGTIQSITEDYLSCMRRHDTEKLRYYLNMQPAIQAQSNLYYEGILSGIPKNSRVQYRILVFPKDSLSVQSDWYTVYACMPDFGFEDIRFMTRGDETADRTHVLYYKQDTLFHHLRVDYTDISKNIPRDFDLWVNDVQFSMSGNPLPWFPYIHPFHDYVVLSIPKSMMPTLNNVVFKGTAIDLSQKTNVGKARLMFIHYCMQGLNDLFDNPNKNYAPYRSYIQTTMRDELATYSSRPNSNERYEEDGYMYTLDAHREHNLKHLWTFNGGVLALMAQDCPEDMKIIAKDIQKGILDPTIAGFGGHRLPYYQEETNRYSIQYGIDMMNNVLGQCNDVYYLDQRVYKQTPNVIDALKKANVRYMVVDASTGFTPYQRSVKTNANADGLHIDHHYLWQDEVSGLYILYIDDEIRNKLMGSTEYEYTRGKLALDMRRKFLYFASHASIRGKNLLIYSDDADKASGNGWFDGDYSGREPEFCDMYKAAIEWIAAHPWIEAVASSDLDPAADCVGTIDMKDATCPSVDPGGSTSIDTYGKVLHFDAWYDNWKQFPARWINKSFEDTSQDIEYTIIGWPAQYRNALYELGKMYFSMSLHESQWNKQPLEFTDPNTRSDVIEPEDFMIAATLQIRNAQVYLNASIWAEWARTYTSNSSYCSNGPVIDLIRQQNIDPWGTGTHWDKDVLENVILYNRHVLVVMDCNGGRITHVFVIRNGKPYCVSGTMKCFQYLTDERLVGENVICDGEVLQNNVYTPNHSYVACDVRESRASGVIGKKFNPKTGVNKELDCYYPDNFNAYTYTIGADHTVEWHYQKTVEPPKPFNLDLFRQLLEYDRNEKVAGRTGVVYHPMPDFKKKIKLVNQSLLIEYEGTTPGHIVANEFSIDLMRGVMYGERNQRRMPDADTVELFNSDGLTVKLTLQFNCAFSKDTLQSTKNLRLHRVLTDCIEVVGENGGDFKYQIDFN